MTTAATFNNTTSTPYLSQDFVQRTIVDIERKLLKKQRRRRSKKKIQHHLMRNCLMGRKQTLSPPEFILVQAKKSLLVQHQQRHLRLPSHDGYGSYYIEGGKCSGELPREGESKDNNSSTYITTVNRRRPQEPKRQQSFTFLYADSSDNEEDVLLLVKGRSNHQIGNDGKDRYRDRYDAGIPKQQQHQQDEEEEEGVSDQNYNYDSPISSFRNNFYFHSTLDTIDENEEKEKEDNNGDYDEQKKNNNNKSQIHDTNKEENQKKEGNANQSRSILRMTCNSSSSYQTEREKTPSQSYRNKIHSLSTTNRHCHYEHIGIHDNCYYYDHDETYSTNEDCDEHSNDDNVGSAKDGDDLDNKSNNTNGVDDDDDVFSEFQSATSSTEDGKDNECTIITSQLSLSCWCNENLRFDCVCDCPSCSLLVDYDYNYSAPKEVDEPLISSFFKHHDMEGDPTMYFGFEGDNHCKEEEEEDDICSTNNDNDSFVSKSSFFTLVGDRYAGMHQHQKDINHHCYNNHRQVNCPLQQQQQQQTMLKKKTTPEGEGRTVAACNNLNHLVVMKQNTCSSPSDNCDNVNNIHLHEDDTFTTSDTSSSSSASMADKYEKSLSDPVTTTLQKNQVANGKSRDLIISSCIPLHINCQKHTGKNIRNNLRLHDQEQSLIGNERQKVGRFYVKPAKNQSLLMDVSFSRRSRTNSF